MASNTHITGAPARASSTRRGILGALALAPAVALPLLPAAALTGNPDHALLTAWATRQAALAKIEQRGSFYHSETHSPDLVDIYDEAEGEIASLPAHTPCGVLVKMWLAFDAGLDGFTEHKQMVKAMARRADLEGLRPHQRPLDWECVVLFSAIDSLSAIAERI